MGGGRKLSEGAGNGLEAEETLEAWAQRRAKLPRPNTRRERHSTRRKTAFDAGSKAGTGALGGIAKGVEKLLSGIFGFLVAEPKLTPEQAKLAGRAANEQAEAHARAAAEQQEHAAQVWDIIDQDRQTAAGRGRKRRTPA